MAERAHVARCVADALQGRDPKAVRTRAVWQSHCAIFSWRKSDFRCSPFHPPSFPLATLTLPFAATATLAGIGRRRYTPSALMFLGASGGLVLAVHLRTSSSRRGSSPLLATAVVIKGLGLLQRRGGGGGACHATRRWGTGLLRRHRRGPAVGRGAQRRPGRADSVHSCRREPRWRGPMPNGDARCVMRICRPTAALKL